MTATGRSAQKTRSPLPSHPSASVALAIALFLVALSATAVQSSPVYTRSDLDNLGLFSALNDRDGRVLLKLLNLESGS